MGRLGRHQPRKEYLTLFNAVVCDVWEKRRQTARDLREDTQRRLHSVERRLDSLEQAFIFEKRIDRTTYERQRDTLREDQSLLEMELHEARVDELDVEGLLPMLEAFASSPAVWQSLVATLFTWGVTALGAAVVFFFKEVSPRALDTA